MASNPRIPYQLSSSRKKLDPPNGKPLIVHFIINVEYWPFDARVWRSLLPEPYGISPSPDVSNYSWYEYGMRCGMPRYLSAFQSRGIPVSCAMNASVIDFYPECAGAIVAADWELIGHNYYQKPFTLENEQETIKTAMDRVTAFTGKPLKGWLSSGMVETANTPELLKAAGIRFICDWGHDDLPTWMKTASGPVIAMPSSLALDDGLVFGVQTRPSDELYNRVVGTVAMFETETNLNPRVITINLHPHLMGEPHRAVFLGKILDFLGSRNDTIFMSGSQLADWYETVDPL